jgi:hypothetical protein
MSNFRVPDYLESSEKILNGAGYLQECEYLCRCDFFGAASPPLEPTATLLTVARSLNSFVVAVVELDIMIEVKE